MNYQEVPQKVKATDGPCQIKRSITDYTFTLCEAVNLYVKIADGLAKIKATEGQLWSKI